MAGSKRCRFRGSLWIVDGVCPEVSGCVSYARALLR
jgi:hypothetical protein